MKTRFGFIDPGTVCAVFNSDIIDYDWAKSVKSYWDNTEVTYDTKNYKNRNAYQLKLSREYNTGTSVRHPNHIWMKMYAELIGNYKNYEIKNS